MENKVGQRVALIGEVNPYGSDPRFALYPFPRNASGDRIRSIFGMTDRQYLTSFSRVNLCLGKWHFVRASLRAEELVRLGGCSVFVLLGAKVREAFCSVATLTKEDTFSVRPFLGIQFVILPHPSGRCREWNNPENVAKARSLLRSAAPWVPVRA